MQITIVETPGRASAKKTLIKLMSKDLDMKAQNRFLKRLRKKHYDPKRRGGRMYGGHMPKLRMLKGERGETAIIRFTPDVARELKSVQQYIVADKRELYEVQRSAFRRTPQKRASIQESIPHSLLTSAESEIQSVVASDVELGSLTDSASGYFIRTRTDGSVRISPTPFSTRRYKVRFADADTMFAAMQEGAEALRVPVINKKRSIISVEPQTDVEGDFHSAHAVDDFLNHISARYKVRISREAQFPVDRDPGDFIAEDPKDRFDGAISKNNAHRSLAEIMKHIGAEAAWTQNQGENTTIAIVDTGVCGSHKEFASHRRAGQWSMPGVNPWEDPVGHGTMVACIAAASTADGGRFKGVAPRANLISCRTDYYDNELTEIYDYLAGLAQAGNKSIGRIIANNSFGVFIDAPPSPSDEDDLSFPDALSDAIDAGVTFVFSAGNKHRKEPTHCAPNSIWSMHKSRADVLTVGNARFSNAVWPSSSRGPGQYYGESWASCKPDVLGVTPRCGWILRGNAVKAYAKWGTSGAAPQASGLCALILSKNPALSCGDVFEIIRETATDLTIPRHCQGHGKINCLAAVNRA